MRPLFLLICVCAAAQEPAEILGRVRHNVGVQVSRSANYSCVETVERNYYFLPQRGGACGRVPAADSQQSRESGHRPTPAIEQHWHLHVHGTSDEQLARVLGQTPGRMPGARKQSQVPRDGGHHDA